MASSSCWGERAFFPPALPPSGSLAATVTPVKPNENCWFPAAAAAAASLQKLWRGFLFTTKSDVEMVKRWGEAQGEGVMQGVGDGGSHFN